MLDEYGFIGDREYAVLAVVADFDNPAVEAFQCIVASVGALIRYFGSGHLCSRGVHGNPELEVVSGAVGTLSKASACSLDVATDIFGVLNEFRKRELLGR